MGCCLEPQLEISFACASGNLWQCSWAEKSVTDVLRGYSHPLAGSSAAVRTAPGSPALPRLVTSLSVAQAYASMQARPSPGLPVLPHAINATRCLGPKAKARALSATQETPWPLACPWQLLTGITCSKGLRKRADARRHRLRLRSSVQAWGRREPRRSQASRRCCACGL